MQTPAPFDYARASSLEHALELLDRHGPDARVVAGGHSLLPMLKLRVAYVDWLVDINDLRDLDYVRVDGDAIAIGALTRHVTLLESPLLAEHYRIFADAERVIADPVVRNRGTIGGSLCQADPSEDLAAVCSALRAEMVLRSAEGTRRVPAREFHEGPYETACRPAEIVTEVRVPIRAGWVGSAYSKVERRAGDWPVAAAGAVVQVDGDTVTDVGIGLTAVGARHFCAPEAEERLRGGPAGDGELTAAAELAARACNPQTDQRGPADYKRHLARELTLRSLRRAVARARGQGG